MQYPLNINEGLIFSQAIPCLHLQLGDVVSEAYNYPLVPALKLARVICQNGRHFTATLVCMYI